MPLHYAHASTRWRALVGLVCASAFHPAMLASQAAARCDPARPLTAYSGRYRQGDVSVLHIDQRGQRLVARPVLWGAVQPLRLAGPDSFVVSDRADRRLVFVRDASGCVAGVSATNLEVDGLARRMPSGERAPIELLIDGDGPAALRAFRQHATLSTAAMVALSRRVLTRLPSRAGAAASFLAALAASAPPTADLLAALGSAQLGAGQRAAAAESYRQALARNSTNAEATTGTRRLAEGDRISATGWPLPFTLRELFRSPTADEQARVRREWASRDRSPQDVAVVARERVTLGGATATAIIVSHLVEGARHFGAILVPVSLPPACCGVVVDVKGIAWNYPPLDVPRHLLSPVLLGDLARKVIFVVPSMRGEVLMVNGKSWVSDGDRTNGFDGGAEDALALVEVALTLVPQANPTRVCAFGHSRGASVALLAAERSRRITCVAAMAGPTDWFSRMPGGAAGWTVTEVVADGLRMRAAPNEDGGQFIERFLLGAIAGRADLAETRLRLLRSSALYFADRLPHAQVHYGLEDPNVPAVNGHALVTARGLDGQTGEVFRAFFYPNAGHDTDRPAAFEHIADFFVRELRLHPSQASRGAPSREREHALGRKLGVRISPVLPTPGLAP